MQDLIQKIPFDLSLVIGIMVVGSGSRSYKDSLSDVDVEVVVPDEIYNSMENTFVPEQDGLELLLLPYREFAAKKQSPNDFDHWPYAHAKVAFDPTGELSKELVRITAMSEELALQRTKLHYFEFLFSINRLEKLLTRGSLLNLSLTVNQAVASLVRLLFTANRQWPPLLHWATQNVFELKGVPKRLVSLATALLEHPSTEYKDQLIAEVERYLMEAGYTCHLSRTELTKEVCSASFREVRERYSVL